MENFHDPQDMDHTSRMMKTMISLESMFDLIWAVKAVVSLELRFRPTNEPCYFS